jgi:hypothetical protein
MPSRIGSGWHQNDADPHADRTPSFTHVGKSEKITFSHNIASLQWFIFLISVKGVIIFSILDSILKFSGKKVYFINFARN